jgi:hypothetical protein
MRLALFLAAAALVIAFTVAQGTLAGNTKAEITQTPAITDCAQSMGAAVQGGHCTRSSLDSTPGFLISHTVLARACAGADLHIIRFAPPGRSVDTPLVATYCG